jgi:N,N-dimethylformamidase
VLSPRLYETGDGLIRSDLVYWPRPHGGAVFSASAISWSGSLSWNDYENNVARISENVLRGFLRPELP